MMNNVNKVIKTELLIETNTEQILFNQVSTQGFLSEAVPAAQAT